MNFSIEISPSTDLETLPALKDVYITLLPGGDFKETADQAEKLVKKGFNPIPHIFFLIRCFCVLYYFCLHLCTIYH